MNNTVVQRRTLGVDGVSTVLGRAFLIRTMGREGRPCGRRG